MKVTTTMKNDKITLNEEDQQLFLDAIKTINDLHWIVDRLEYSGQFTAKTQEYITDLLVSVKRHIEMKLDKKD